jgi:CRISPR-associated endonuclease Csn1
VIRTGARIFEAGVEGDIESGREESKGLKRRTARSQRRQTDRRRRRLEHTYHLLQRWGLLPAGLSTPVERQEAVNELDKELAGKHSQHGVLPYFLRARAIDERLEPFELGRALYHLAQRRGFQSNRKAAAKEDEKERSEVKASIKDLWAKMGDLTLGQYFAGLDPHELRIRKQWTHRDMYKREFAAIWDAQAPHHPDLLTDERRKELNHALFFQRPLKPTDDLIGDCELQSGEKRAPAGHWIAQRFRMVQTVNNLRARTPDGIERELTPAQRESLIEHLERFGDTTLYRARTFLGFDKSVRFNLEEGGEKNLKGNRTSAKLREIFGERWDEMPPDQRDDLMNDLLKEQSDEELAAAACQKWQLDAESAQRLADVRLEDKYLSLSLGAMRRLLVHMEAGVSFMNARQAEYPENFEAADPLDRLPAIKDCKDLDVRNPAVLRALTELRKVVNAVVARYGKPQSIHIELARDLRRSAEERRRMSNRMRKREEERDIVKKLIRETTNERPSERDIEIGMLARECDCTCPYTGHQFSWSSLFGGQSQAQVEHVIPYSRSLDDSFANKTLCYHEANARKANRTPREAYAPDEQRWHEIIERVKRFQGEFAKEKLRRFQEPECDTEKLLEEFTQRQLQDTRYASRLAAKYVGMLFGGVVDASGQRRVVTCAGGVTAALRRLWGLNRILSEGDKKQRTDHRHHSVDAATVALTTHRAIKMLSDEARRTRDQGQARLKTLEAPWPGFVDDLARAIGETLVSVRPEHRLAGALHEETIYSAPRRGAQGREFVAVRKPVHLLTAKDIEGDAIIDPVVRERVRLQLGIVGGDPRKLENNLPTMVSGVRIRRVRIQSATATVQVGEGYRLRHVALKDNHHMEVVALLDKNGKEAKWEGHVVSRFEAVMRHKRREPVVRRDHGTGRKFKFSLASGDLIEIDAETERRCLYLVRCVSGANVEMTPANDARRQQEQRKGTGKVWIKRSTDRLFELHCRKVTVAPIGEVIPAND